jgi:hypothetical protein
MPKSEIKCCASTQDQGWFHPGRNLETIYRPYSPESLSSNDVLRLYRKGSRRGGSYREQLDRLMVGQCSYNWVWQGDK